MPDSEVAVGHGIWIATGSPCQNADPTKAGYYLYNYQRHDVEQRDYDDPTTVLNKPLVITNRDGTESPSEYASATVSGPTGDQVYCSYYSKYFGHIQVTPHGAIAGFDRVIAKNMSGRACNQIVRRGFNKDGCFDMLPCLVKIGFQAGSIVEGQSAIVTIERYDNDVSWWFQKEGSEHHVYDGEVQSQSFYKTQSSQLRMQDKEGYKTAI